jgi:hypothetical protein
MGLILIIFLIIAIFAFGSNKIFQNGTNSINSTNTNSEKTPSANINSKNINTNKSTNNNKSNEQTNINNVDLNFVAPKNTNTSDTGSSSSQTISSTNIKIMNASGKTGLAAKLKGEMEAIGYTINSIGSTVDIYQQNKIYYQDGYKDKADKIASDFPNLKFAVEQQTKNEGSNILIIIFNYFN